MVGPPHPPYRRPVSDRTDRADLLLACSAGGHLLQLLALRDAWQDFSRVWVTDDKTDARSLLRDERVQFCYGPPNRHPANVARNIALAWRLVRRHRPAVVLTTGAGSAVPFAVVARRTARASSTSRASRGRRRRRSAAG